LRDIAKKYAKNPKIGNIHVSTRYDVLSEMAPEMPGSAVMYDVLTISVMTANSHAKKNTFMIFSVHDIVAVNPKNEYPICSPNSISMMSPKETRHARTALKVLGFVLLRMS
jgi:hypothetical protein